MGGNSAAPERSVCRAKRAVSFVQKRFGFRQTNAPVLNFQRFSRPILPREARQNLVGKKDESLILVGADGIGPSASVLSGQRSATELRAPGNPGHKNQPPPHRVSSRSLTLPPLDPFLKRRQILEKLRVVHRLPRVKDPGLQIKLVIFSPAISRLH